MSQPFFLEPHDLATEQKRITDLGKNLCSAAQKVEGTTIDDSTYGLIGKPLKFGLDISYNYTGLSLDFLGLFLRAVAKDLAQYIHDIEITDDIVVPPATKFTQS